MIGAAGPAEFSRHEFCLRQRHIFYKSSHNWSSACSSAPMTGQRVFFSRLTWCHELGPSWVPQRYFQFRSFRLFILSDAIHQILGIRELKPNSSQPKGSTSVEYMCHRYSRLDVLPLDVWAPQNTSDVPAKIAWFRVEEPADLPEWPIQHFTICAKFSRFIWQKFHTSDCNMVDTVWLEELWQHQHLSCPFVAGSC